MEEKLKHLIIEMMVESVLKAEDFHSDIIVDIKFDEPLRFDKLFGIVVPIQDYLYSQFELDTVCNKINDAIRLDASLSSIREVSDYLSDNASDTVFYDTDYTYNYEFVLSHYFCFRFIDIDGDKYCLLRLYKRGGHPKPRLFKLANPDTFCLGGLVSFYTKEGDECRVFDSFMELKTFAEEKGLEINEKNGVGYLGGEEIKYDLLYKK